MSAVGDARKRAQGQEAGADLRALADKWAEQSKDQRGIARRALAPGRAACSAELRALLAEPAAEYEAVAEQDVPRTFGVERIAAERQRQIAVEGYSVKHDAEHDDGALAMAAAVYAEKSTKQSVVDQFPRLVGWPWRDEDFKPVDRLTCLTKAGALIAAEIDRLASATSKDVNAPSVPVLAADGGEVEVLAKAILGARWPDGSRDGFPTSKIATMLADHLASDWLADLRRTERAKGAREALLAAAAAVRAVRENGLPDGVDSHPTAEGFEDWLIARAASGAGQ